MLRPGVIKSGFEEGDSMCVYVTKPSATNKPFMHTAAGLPYLRAVLQSCSIRKVGGGHGVLLHKATQGVLLHKAFSASG